jgi:hypothetical protein
MKFIFAASLAGSWIMIFGWWRADGTGADNDYDDGDDDDNHSICSDIISGGGLLMVCLNLELPAVQVQEPDNRDSPAR